MTGRLRNVALLAVSVSLAACGIFSDKEDEELEPAKLIKFEETVRIKRSWSAKLGDEAEFLRLALRPAADGARIYAASADGKVSAFEPETGKRIWQTKLDVGLAAGPGVGGDLLVVISRDGEVIALDPGDGSERWRNGDGVESLAAPVIADEVVLVQSVDNRLRALQSFDGRERWVSLQSVPVLTMRGTSTPLVVAGNAIAGFDNGRLVAIDIDTGDTVWETLLAPPTGRSDLERLADIDGQMAVVGQDIYAAGYNGRVGAVAAESGQTLWAVDVSSYEGVAADWNSLYTVQDEGVLISLLRRNGTESWRQDALLRREPTLPVPFLTTVVSGDFQGYLHFFSNVSGDPVARVRFGKAGITATPLVLGERLYVQSDSGNLAAFEIVQPDRPRNRAPDIAEEGV